MKTFLYIFLFFSGLAFSQKGQITGKILDMSSKEAMPYAEILVQHSDNKKFSEGTLSDEKGNFTLKNLPFGTYFLKIHFIGYEPLEKTIHLSTSKVDLGVFLLSPITETLSETIVEGKKGAFSYGVDKKTINASAFPDATNAVDLLTNVPSIQVSVDGKISYREGGKFKVYINGIAVPNGEERLKTLDASQIEKIDIITNPSARYSSEGTAGIIRILLKKN